MIRPAPRSLLMVSLAIGPLYAQQPSAEAVQFFESKVRPIFASQCYGCHSGKSRIASGGLKLDTRNGFFQGGQSGPPVVPGRPDESKLISAIQYTSELKMPPAGKLKQDQIDILTEWIRFGAAWPEEATDPKEAANAEAKKKAEQAKLNHWAWTPPKKVSIPAVRDTSWPSSEIDRFILAKLEEKGLKPSADADPRVLVRRVYFDLTGLPPTPKVVSAFAANPSPPAFEQIVDGLLASPEFGERWGRHWLDVTYFADNLEIGRRIPATEAWRYRDYVINAFNQDKPFQQFIKEQIAGDLLPAETDAEKRERLIATGFLALGPWPLVSSDKEQLRMDVVDLQADMIGKAFLGLTIGCARCHDHKFDPISAKDYYAIGGILSSTQTLNGRIDGVFSDVNRAPLPETAEELRVRAQKLEEFTVEITPLRAKRKTLTAEIERLKKPAETEAGSTTATGSVKDGKEPVPGSVGALEKELAEVIKRIDLLEFNRPEPPSAFSVRDIESPADIHINIRGNAHTLGEEVPRSFIKAVMWDGPPSLSYRESGRLQLAQWVASEKNPLTSRVAVNRVWQHLFGFGIVRSVDNFGLRGDLPTHPELLDYLAQQLVADDWSIKKMVRRIVLSRTYREASDHNVQALQTDPENRLLWRANRRRLEGETIRDAILAMTGTLDRTRGGPTLPVAVPGNVSFAKPAELKDSAVFPPELLKRRTVYLPVLRKSQHRSLDILNLFDFPDVNQVSGARSVTTVPTQALYLINSPFFKEQSTILARHVLDSPGTDEKRVSGLIETLFNRPAGDEELRQGTDFVKAYIDEIKGSDSVKDGGQLEAWARYCHALMASNEFLYLR